MIHKFQAGIEASFLFITIKWQPLFGFISLIIYGVYYLSMLKMNVIDKNYGGSWKKYFKSIFKRN